MQVQFLVIDLFCGFGGTTTGFEKAQNAKVIACVNHDPNAIKSHWLNHPDVKHFEEDIRKLDLTELVAVLHYWKAVYPEAKVILWASLECTNFSKAKGGMPREADSRTLADYLDRYILALDPDYVQIENVVEFMSWGPLDENGKPVSRKNGSDWLRWRNRICRIGYFDDWRELNSADFGAYTSRNRLFGIFAKEGLQIAWPEPTHAKNPEKAGIFGGLKKWKAVKDVLDLEDEGQSIFDRKRPLVPRTLERIHAGLVKFVAAGDERFISKYYGSGGQLSSVNAPAGTLTTKDRMCKVQAVWLDKQYTGPLNKQSIDRPAGTIMANDKHALVHAQFISNQYGSGSQNNSIEGPARTVTTTPKQFLVSAERSFILQHQFGNTGTSIEQPSPTLIARMDKKPPYLVSPELSPEQGMPQLKIQLEDCPQMVKIKKFMHAYGIADIKMRMLKLPELLKIQGFPSNYKMHGTQSDRKKFAGNSVVPHVVKAWSLALGSRLLKQEAA